MSIQTATHHLQNPMPDHYFAMVDTYDASEHSNVAYGWQHFYTQVEKRPFRGQFTELVLPSMQIIHERLDQPALYQGRSWDGALVFILALDAVGTTTFSRNTVAPNSICVYPQRWLFQWFANGPTEGISITVKEDILIERAKQELGAEFINELMQIGFCVKDTKVVNAFLNFVTSTLANARERPDHLYSKPEQIELGNEGLDVLIEILKAGQTVPRKLPPPSTWVYIVGKALKYMDEHISDQLLISDMCSAIRVRPRTVRYSFQQVLGSTPKEYLLAFRLGRVRSELQKMEKPTGNIHRIAERYGFVHLGRFSNFYHEAFGEYPSETFIKHRIQA